MKTTKEPTNEFDSLTKELTALKGLIYRIQGALNTEETGDGLVEVALNAHLAEIDLAKLERAKQ